MDTYPVTFRETNVQGLLLDSIQKVAPEAYEKRIKRRGIVNAWDDEDFAKAVRDLGKKNLIVAGVTTDVCLVPPALSMQGEGFHIKVETCGLLGARASLHHTVRT